MAKCKELSFFCRQLWSILKSGINLYDAFEILDNFSLDRDIKKTIPKIRNDLFTGESLYISMNKHRRVYKDFFINMIKIGEESGNLEGMLHESYKYFYKKDKLFTSLFNSLLYPIILSMTIIAVVIFLNENILPKVISTLISMGGKLPPITLFIINLNIFFKSSTFKIFLLSVILIFILIKFLLIKKSIYLYHYYYRGSLIKKVYEYYFLLNTSRALCTLIKNGISIMQSLSIIYENTKDRFYKEKIYYVLGKVKSGEQISVCLKSVMNNPFYISMVTIGEKTGKIDEMLEASADIIEEEMEKKIKRLVGLIEPAMIIFLALISGTVILSFVFPMVNLMDSIH